MTSNGVAGSLSTWSRRPGPGIIDALDEGFYRGTRVEQTLDWLREVIAAAGARVHVIAFSRSSHEQKSIHALGWESVGRSVTWHLQPFDSEQAALQLSPGDPEKGRRGVANARHHVRSLNEPSLVRDFRVLACLANIEQDETITPAQLEWRVVRQLCESPRSARTGESLTDRIDAAARMAAVLQFSGVETVDIDNEHGPTGAHEKSPVAFFDAFPKSSASVERAARELARSPLFHAVDGRGYRFRQHFAKERLAAYALSRRPHRAGPAADDWQARRHYAGSTRSHEQARGHHRPRRDTESRGRPATPAD
jgi:hypothetical protein